MENLLTGYECLALFTDEVQERIKAAIINDPFNKGVDNAWEVAMEHKYIIGSSFLAANFTWSGTPEGYYYWENLADKHC